mgnify:CR=1 FL=1
MQVDCPWVVPAIGVWFIGHLDLEYQKLTICAAWAKLDTMCCARSVRPSYSGDGWIGYFLSSNGLVDEVSVDDCAEELIATYAARAEAINQHGT